MKSTLIASLFCFVTLSAWAAERTVEIEEQVLEVSTINGAILSDPLLALSKGSETYLPLLDTMKILGVPFEQPAPGAFKLYRTQTEFDVMDFTRCKTEPSPACQAMIEKNGSYYVKVSYLKDTLLWPISADLKSMQVIVNAGPKANENYVKTDAPDHPYILIRKKFGYPALRVEATGSSDPKINNLNLYETQPLLDHDSDMLLSTNSEATSFRWTLSKEVVESNSPYEIKNYELISTQSLDTKYLFSPTQLTGVHFSNIKSGENVFDTQNLYDKAPPRWKVELFVNEIYLGETFADTNGNFSFLNVPIFYGQTRIHYRLTSPLGKTMEVDRTLNVTNDFQGVGKIKYQAAYGQMLNTSDNIGSAIVNYGLSPLFSAQAGYAQFVMSDTLEQKKYSLMGLSILQPSYSLSALRINSFNNLEHAWVITPKANIGRVLLSGEYTTFANFKSLLINTHSGDDMTAIKKISVMSPLAADIPMTTQLNLIESTFNSIPSSQQAQVRLYTMFTASSLLVESNKFWPSEANPDLYVEFGSYSRQLRAKYGVLMQNDLYAKSKADIEYLIQENMFATFSADAPANISDGAYAVGLNKLLGEVQAELSTQYSRAETRVNLTLSTNVKTSEEGLRFSQEEGYRQANIEIFAFLDENSNGVRDAGEKPYSRLRVLETHRQKEYETNDQGRVLISSLSPYERVSFQVVKESISNIFLTAQDFQSDFILTPSQQLKIEIPVKPTFDVRGNVKILYYKKLVPLEILNEQGVVVATTTSSSSGHYKFTDLAGGKYTVRVQPGFLNDNILESVPASVQIDLTGKAGVRTAAEIEILVR